MHKNKETSIRCFQSKAYPSHLQCNGNPDEGFPQHRDENSIHPRGGVVVERDYFAPPAEGYQYHRSTMHQPVPVPVPEFYIWSPFNNDFHTTHFYPPVNYDYGFPMDNRFQCGSYSYQMLSESHPFDSHAEDFQYFVVIDFEATCDKEKSPHPQEIIEFPSVLVNSRTGELEDSFQIYVRPTYNQSLSEFCKELTGIQQNQVDKGVLLSDALLMHDKWLEEKGIKQTNFAVVTWSDWDCRVMLESECYLKGIWKPPYFNRWINLRVPFYEAFGRGRCNLKEAVQRAGLEWEGRAHCGLDDAKNTARLLGKIMKSGRTKVSITTSLKWPSADRPHMVDPQFFPGVPHKVKQQPLAPFFQFRPLAPNQGASLAHFYPIEMDPAKQHGFCHCGVESGKRMYRMPAPYHGNFSFSCGNSTCTRLQHFF